jgi:hypothetical protein
MRKVSQLVIVVLILLVCSGILLAAIQKARGIQDRMYCRINIKQIGLALNNYYDTNGHLPSGTVPNDKLPAEKRLSWLFDILPFVEASPRNSRFNRKDAWDSEENLLHSSESLRFYLCPANPERKDPTAPALTNYVGIAGIGADAALLSKKDPKAGVFGYDRIIRYDDISDGISNTMTGIETETENGPWAAGGRPTVRGLVPGSLPYLGRDGQFSSKHYIDGPPFSLSCPHLTNAVFVDGSVHTLSSSIDPRVFEALATIAGKDDVGDFGD